MCVCLFMYVCECVKRGYNVEPINCLWMSKQTLKALRNYFALLWQPIISEHASPLDIFMRRCMLAWRYFFFFCFNWTFHLSKHSLTRHLIYTKSGSTKQLHLFKFIFLLQCKSTDLLRKKKALDCGSNRLYQIRKRGRANDYSGAYIYTNGRK